jgi:hypothetical protein
MGERCDRDSKDPMRGVKGRQTPTGESRRSPLTWLGGLLAGLAAVAGVVFTVYQYLQKAPELFVEPRLVEVDSRWLGDIVARDRELLSQMADPYGLPTVVENDCLETLTDAYFSKTVIFQGEPESARFLLLTNVGDRMIDRIELISSDDGVVGDVGHVVGQESILICTEVRFQSGESYSLYVDRVRLSRDTEERQQVLRQVKHGEFRSKPGLEGISYSYPE